MTPRGWCPSMYEPMEAGDGWLVRVKPPGSTLTATEAHVLAEAARRFGNGLIGLTSRANLQFRGLSPQTTRPFAEIVLGLGLATANPAAERRRTVMLAPLAGPAAHDLSHRLETMLVDKTDFATLPAKFGLAVDDGPVSIAAAPADIRLRMTPRGVEITLDGSSLAALCHPADATAATARLAAAFLATGAHRMRHLHAAPILAAAHLTPAVATPRPHQPPLIGRRDEGFGLGLPFGAMTAAELDTIATHAKAEGDSTLRLTPWRALFLPGARTAPPGFITTQTDSMLSIEACAGAPACPHANVPTRDDAAWLAQNARLPTRIHISGCQKGCAHPGPAPLTLVGDAGRYNLVRNGRASDAPSQTGLSIADIASILTAPAA